MRLMAHVQLEEPLTPQALRRAVENLNAAIPSLYDVEQDGHWEPGTQPRLFVVAGTQHRAWTLMVRAHDDTVAVKLETMVAG